MAKLTIKGIYSYGRDPNPRNWHQAVDALKSIKKVKRVSSPRAPKPEPK